MPEKRGKLTARWLFVPDPATMCRWSEGYLPLCVGIHPLISAPWSPSGGECASRLQVMWGHSDPSLASRVDSENFFPSRRGLSALAKPQPPPWRVM